MKSFLLLLAALVLGNSLCAQSSIDVKRYIFAIEVTDQSDSISGEATIDFLYTNKPVGEAPEVAFDLRQSHNATGFTVSSVTSYGRPVNFRQQDDRVVFDAPSRETGKSSVVIRYSGRPADGLIISKNKFGNRTFFSDNWPNRARQWIPCVDDPADKAAVSFIITAPAHYQVISNGVLISKTQLDGDRTRTEWNEPVPLPTKVMVVGIAAFATAQSGIVGTVPVTSWVFPENSKQGFRDYGIAVPILSWMQNYIGPFPYRKLAHVQSKTIFGGMENAGAIFYYENSVNGRTNNESLIAHETVHQYFGDMVTEARYSHVWLSEGFATYLTHLFIGSKYGPDSLAAEMGKDRDRVINYSRTKKTALIDSVSPLMDLLNINSYQKGSWVLHMLRCETGDSLFRSGIREYYRLYAGQSVLSSSLQQVFEKITGKSLQQFFKQWLYQAGQPDLEISWRYNNMSKSVDITVRQVQHLLFSFPLRLDISSSNNKHLSTQLAVTGQTQTFSIPVDFNPDSIFADPLVELLYSGKIERIQ